MALKKRESIEKFSSTGGLNTSNAHAWLKISFHSGLVHKSESGK